MRSFNCVKSIFVSPCGAEEKFLLLCVLDPSSLVFARHRQWPPWPPGGDTWPNESHVGRAGWSPGEVWRRNLGQFGRSGSRQERNRGCSRCGGRISSRPPRADLLTSEERERERGRETAGRVSPPFVRCLDQELLFCCFLSFSSFSDRRLVVGRLDGDALSGCEEVGRTDTRTHPPGGMYPSGAVTGRRPRRCPACVLGILVLLLHGASGESRTRETPGEGGGGREGVALWTSTTSSAHFFN